jgi:amidophosphoribosyltransferase
MAGLCANICFDSNNTLNASSEDLEKILFFLQHRGQKSAKMLTLLHNPNENVYFYNNNVRYKMLVNTKYDHLLFSEKIGDGSIRDLFGAKVLSNLYGDFGIAAACEYPANKSDSLPYRYKMIATCKDGFIPNYDEIRAFLIKNKIPIDNSKGNIGLLSKLFHFNYFNSKNGLEAMKKCAEGSNDSPKIKGSYSMLALTPEGIIACNNGKPLGYMLLKDRVYFSSESPGPCNIAKEVNFNNFYTLWNEILPGNIVEIKKSGEIKNENFQTNNKICSFEYAYFARPESILSKNIKDGVSKVREKIGASIAPKVLESLIADNEDLSSWNVVPVLSSGEWYALGLAEKIGIKYLPVISRDKNAKKSFNLLTQEEREKEVALKFIFPINELRDKNIILVDDSIVRGTTMKIVVDYLHVKSGVKKIYVVSGFPEKRNPCLFVPNKKDKLIAKDLNVEAIAKHIGVEKLFFGNIKDWMNVLYRNFCFDCALKN